MITDNQVEAVHIDMWGKAVIKHGAVEVVPENEAQHISDYVRGMYVIQVWQKNGSVGSVLKFMKSYSLPDEIVSRLAHKYCGIKLTELITSVEA